MSKGKPVAPDSAWLYRIENGVEGRVDNPEIARELEATSARG